MIIRIMGCGTSTGVPVPGCSCSVCQSNNLRNKRMRSSVLVIDDRNPLYHRNIVIDTGPDFRVQAIESGIRKVDAVLYTHDHADHLHGIDDLRPLSGGSDIPVYGSSEFCGQLLHRFPYIFGESVQKGGGKPRLTLHDLGSARISALNPAERDGGSGTASLLPMPFSLYGIPVQPVPVMHGKLPIFGYRIADLAYITDCSYFPEESLALMKGVKVLILGALRHRPHETHFTILQAIELAQRIKPERCILTHLGHEVDYNTVHAELPEKIEVAYDAMEFSIPFK